MNVCYSSLVMLSMPSRGTCLLLEYDIREAVCCENQLHPEAGLSCCGKEVFNPAVATCCKVKYGDTTTGNDSTLVSNRQESGSFWLQLLM